MRVVLGNWGVRDTNRGLEVALWENAVMEKSGGRLADNVGGWDGADFDRLNNGKLSATKELRTRMDGKVAVLDWFDTGRIATTYARAPGTGSHSTSAHENAAEAAAAAHDENSACCSSVRTYCAPCTP